MNLKERIKHFNKINKEIELLSNEVVIIRSAILSNLNCKHLNLLTPSTYTTHLTKQTIKVTQK